MTVERVDYCPLFIALAIRIASLLPPEFSLQLATVPGFGDKAFAIACFHKGKEAGDRLGFIAGKVLDVRKDPLRGSIDVVVTDIPLWEGDSGGPMFLNNGKLAGVASGFTLKWHGYYWKYERYYFFPDEDFIRGVIAKDHDQQQSSNPVR